MNKKIEIELSLSSVKKTIRYLKNIKNKIPIIHEQFAYESMVWLQNRAQMILERESKYQGTTDINDNWLITRIPSKSGGIAYELRNTSPFSAIVEFGTGRVGQDQSHTMASVVGYKYGHKSWSFVRDLTSNEWVVHSNVSSEEIKENPSRYLVINDFDGYVGKSYLYDAFYDYFYVGYWKKIYQSVFDRYIK